MVKKNVLIGNDFDLKSVQRISVIRTGFYSEPFKFNLCTRTYQLNV